MYTCPITRGRILAYDLPEEGAEGGTERRTEKPCNEEIRDV